MTLAEAKKERYKMRPHLHGDWVVTETEFIDATHKGMSGPELLEGETKIVFTGNLVEAMDFLNRINDPT